MQNRNAPSPFVADTTPCVCFDRSEDCCLCGDEERILRFVVQNDGRLSDAQREWCVDQIRWVGDNTSQPSDDEIAAMTHGELARATIVAWSDYAKSVS